jgi:acyl carrier protein
MNSSIEKSVKLIIANSVGDGLNAESIDNDLQLIGNLLDSMTVTNLIVGLEEYFEIYIAEEELSEDIFYTVDSLISFVKQKIA